MLESHFSSYLSQFLPRDRSAPILDVGCGGGEMILLLQKMGYTDVRGIDLSEEQVKEAISRGAKDVEVVDAMEYLSRREGEFHLILALDVIEHLSKEEVLPFLDAVHAALVEDGTLILSTPNMASPFGARIAFGDFTHEVGFTPVSIGQVLRASGFELVGIFPCEPTIHGLASALRWLAWKILNRLIRLYLIAETGLFEGEVHTQVMYVVGRKKTCWR
jgi:predicted TPR repeat methyltransferase